MESSSESWGALLLSLRELLEWTIRKDTDLGRLGLVTGDVAALQRQQVRWGTDGRCRGLLCAWPNNIATLFKRTMQHMSGHVNDDFRSTLNLSN